MAQEAQAVTYDSVVNELNNFTLADAADRDEAMKMVEEFMDVIRPKIDQVYRENPNLTAEQKRVINEKEAAIFSEVDTQFPAEGGRRRRGSRRKVRKTRKARKTNRKASRKSR